MQVNALRLLAQLRAEGFTLEAGPDGLRVSPAEAITPALREVFTAHKGELLAALADEASVRAMLAEMRPFLNKRLRALSDDDLLLLAQWNIHVAAERTIAGSRGLASG